MFSVDPLLSKNKIISERRIGRFAYDNDFLMNSPQSLLKNIFSKIIPIDIQFDYALQRFVVRAFSEFFDSIEIGEQIPEYQIHVRVSGKKKTPSYYVTFKPVENNSLLSLLS